MTELQTEGGIGGAPNDFVLQSQDVQVSFAETSFTGEPRFHYRDSSRELNASGKEIQQVETELGKLVTVFLEPDVAVDGSRDPTEFDGRVDRVSTPKTRKPPGVGATGGEVLQGGQALKRIWRSCAWGPE